MSRATTLSSVAQQLSRRSASGSERCCCTPRSPSAAARARRRRFRAGLLRDRNDQPARAPVLVPLPRDAGAEIGGRRAAPPEAVATEPAAHGAGEPGQRSARFTSRAAAFCGRAIKPD
jgi:hypothetical protein